MAMEHLEEKGRALGNFQRHALRLSRQFLRLHTTLRELQAERKSAPKQSPQSAPEPTPNPEKQNEQIEPKLAQPARRQTNTRPPAFRPAVVRALELHRKPPKPES